MPNFTIQFTRWEPYTGHVTVTARTRTEALRRAREQVMDCRLGEPASTLEPRVTGLVIVEGGEG